MGSPWCMLDAVWQSSVMWQTKAMHTALRKIARSQRFKVWGEGLTKGVRLTLCGAADLWWCLPSS